MDDPREVEIMRRKVAEQLVVVTKGMQIGPITQQQTGDTHTFGATVTRKP